MFSNILRPNRGIWETLRKSQKEKLWESTTFRNHRVLISIVEASACRLVLITQNSALLETGA
ncbi:hypothetical protein [Thalassoglobus neptunius]|uniref:hypothetical protein n=1 Tax=Thalassoglobus neptunius TaxID=1938619 RepID=UPI0011B4B847|nr:hypothetical protein [Thalassoglobus neptunius]